MKLLQRFWQDDRGFVVSLETVLTAVILVFGMIVGLQVLRDAIVQELADLANAVSSLNSGMGGGGGGGGTVTVTLGVMPTPEA